ncbi:protein TolQ [Methylophilaceae bacterium]|jgi:biopolymer transport protein TolQ|nr:protein TolQ [Methylophilaceae bacterium]MDA7842509.1 protein TolQ [Methylophilaceae bacterium]
MNIGSDLSFFSLIWEASLPVQAVMLILVIASMASWKIIYLKIRTLKMAEQNTDDFEKIFWSGGSLSNLYESVSIRPPKDMLGLPMIFKAGYKEYMSNKNTGALDKKSIESVRRAMSASYNREVDTIDRHLPFLASVGSVSPYIGLFGTVWGIMNAFIGLANVAQASLAQVAPGIAEALIATAIGLFAAIPAVIAYNKFASKVDRISIRYESFMEEFINIMDRKG